MRIVVALGGNALLWRGERPDATIQLGHIKAAAAALARLAAEHDLLICHGNGPQVGLLAIESEADASLSRPYPLDVLGAQTQGMIGYWLAQTLRNAGVPRPVVSIVTQTLVEAADPAFTHPSKLVGSVYTSERAHQLAGQHGWDVAEDGAGWRRVVASPVPVRVVEQATIAQLLDANSIVIAGGGGGAPVIAGDDGALSGVEAVVDKDLVAALLGVSVAADRLLVLTDVTAVMSGFGTPRARALPSLDLDELAGLSFPEGSMGPKIDACRRFVATTSHPAAIGCLSDASAILAGTAGTTITRSTR